MAEAVFIQEKNYRLKFFAGNFFMFLIWEKVIRIRETNNAYHIDVDMFFFANAYVVLHGNFAGGSIRSRIAGTFQKAY